MSKVLMSIKSEYVAKILAGQKQFEFRKRKCAQEIESIVIYETAPTKLIVAEVEVIQVVMDTPALVWERTKHAAGIDKQFFDQYYRDKKMAVAYALGSVTCYNPPRTLADYGITSAPQSYVYLSEDSFAK